MVHLDGSPGKGYWWRNLVPSNLIQWGEVVFACVEQEASHVNETPTNS